VIAAKDNNASDEVRTVVKKVHKTKPNGQMRKYLNFSGEKPSTPILDTINYPVHMKNLSIQVYILK
jgi:1-deoxy-D-xylulose-5-phosphate synthase